MLMRLFLSSLRLPVVCCHPSGAHYSRKKSRRAEVNPYVGDFIWRRLFVAMGYLFFGSS
ncbi:hypothetical protein RSG09_003512 [Yersinia enterocolitica]|nr:hypothetical protein [Yersinia enterocolitica]